MAACWSWPHVFSSAADTWLCLSHCGLPPSQVPGTDHHALAPRCTAWTRCVGCCPSSTLRSQISSTGSGCLCSSTLGKRLLLPPNPRPLWGLPT